MNNKRIFPEWFINELVNDEDKEKARNGELKTTDRVNFKCEHDHIYPQEIRNHIILKSQKRRFGCPICAEKLKIGRNNYASRKKNNETDKYELLNNSRKRTYPEWFINELNNEDEKRLILENKLHVRNKVEFKCDKCGNVYKQQIRLHIKLSSGERDQGCPRCASIKKNIEKSEKDKSKRVYPEWFINELVNEEDKIRARNKELKSEDRVKFRCEKNHIYESSVYNHIRIRDMKKKHGCPVCGIQKSIDGTIRASEDKRKEYPQWFIDELANEEDKELARTRKLAKNDKVTFQCQKGHIYEQTIHLHLKSDGSKGCGCPKCSNNRSKVELEIEEYIKSFGLYVEHKRIGDNRKYEIDILISEKNIGIEYNGSYYHKTLPNDEYSKSKLYHQEKFNECKKNDIHLITIFDVDWKRNSAKIKAYLENIFSSKEKIYARNCEVKEITFKEANNLYMKYHLLGKLGMSNVDYGLFFNNELISCMSFQEKRYKEGWCLCRFVTNSKYLVVGGASRLFSAFIKNYNPEKVISFSDNDYFTGGVYEKLGFRNNGSTYSPRYYWYLDDKELNREKCQLKKLKIKYPILYNESISQNEIKNKEDYIMLRLGAFKVYRSGHTKWVWDNKY